MSPNCYRDLKVPRESSLRLSILGGLLEIQRVISEALAGINANRLMWGPLSAQEFLRILIDVTTWSLTHFEPVRAWSIAEELTPTEQQEGYGLIGRIRRMSAAQYPSSRTIRTLQDLTHPKVRGSALWVEHSLLSASHASASDRGGGGSAMQERQTARVMRSAPLGREWLASRQDTWSSDYRRNGWINLAISGQACPLQ